MQSISETETKDRQESINSQARAFDDEGGLELQPFAVDEGPGRLAAS